MSSLWSDVRYSLRQLKRQSRLTLVIVFTLGSALGVSASLFAFLNTAFLQPWRVRDPDRVVLVRSAGYQSDLSPDDWRHWTESAKSFQGLTAGLGRHGGLWQGGRLRYEIVSANYFEVLGVALERGRAFDAEDDRSGGPGREAVVNHRFWRDHLGADPGVLGRAISLNGVAFTIVGVVARGFSGTDFKRVDIWLPLAADPRLHGNRSDPRRLIVAGRLAPGASREQAEAELTALRASFRSQRGLAASAVVVGQTDPVSSKPTGFAQGIMLSGFLVAVLCVTLVACANVANLLLARGNARRGEIAVRLSLGASRARLVRQLLVEAFLLVAGGGLVGLAIATVLPDVVFGSVPQIAEGTVVDFPVDGRVVGWVFGVSTVACLAFGLAPALQCTRISFSHALKDVHGVSVPSLRSALPGYQIAVSFVVLVVSGLLVRSAQTSGLGYAVDDLAFVRMEAPATYDAARRRRVAEEMFERLQGMAGSTSVAAASEDPILDRFRKRLYVTPGYFDVVRIPIVAGRTFTPVDAPDRAIILGEGFARRFFGKGNPVGRRLASGPGLGTFSSLLEGREVVGVARDADPAFLDSAADNGYFPAPAEKWRVFVLRDPGRGARGAIAPALARIDPAVSIEVLSGTAWLEDVLWQRLFWARVMAGLGVLAMALAMLGLFSLMAYSVERRTREIGLRIALGAGVAAILRAVLLPVSRAMLVGLGLGGLGAAGAAFLLRRVNLVSGLNPLDAITYAAVAVALMAAAVVASYLPVRRATRVEPTIALRYE